LPSPGLAWGMTLNWETSYAVALELRRSHPEIDVNTISLRQIYDWTLALPEFEDDPALCNDEILASIFQEWYEETAHDRH
jgi:FeS assembly protein IscX